MPCALYSHSNSSKKYKQKTFLVFSRQIRKHTTIYFKGRKKPYKLLKIQHLLVHINFDWKQYYCKNDVTNLFSNLLMTTN